MKKNTSYVHLLSKKFNSKNAKWIDDNFVETDMITRSVFVSNSPNVDSANIYQMVRWLEIKGLVNPIHISSKINLNMSVEEFAKCVQGEVEEKLLNELLSFSKQAGVSLNNKSLAAAIWANIIHNSTSNKNKDLINDLSYLFLAVTKVAEGNKTLSIDELISQTHDAFLLETKVNDYFNLANLELQDSDNWFDFSTYPYEIVDEEMNYDLQIFNNDQLFDALKNFKNLPSIAEYIENVYLNNMDEKSDGYCQDSLIADYKALSIILKIINEKFSKDENFDKDKNIGINLNIKLAVTEKLILKEHPNYQNSEVISGFKTQARRIASSILGLQTKKANDYSVFNKILDKYIDVCDFVIENIEDHKVELSSYLRKLGALKPMARVERENTEVLIERVEKLRTQASELQRALKTKDQSVSEKVASSKRIKNSQEVSQELEMFKKLKSTQPYSLLKPSKAVSKIVTKENAPNLYNYVEISKLQPSRIKMEEVQAVQQVMHLPADYEVENH